MGEIYLLAERLNFFGKYCSFGSFLVVPVAVDVFGSLFMAFEIGFSASLFMVFKKSYSKTIKRLRKLQKSTK